MLLQEHQMEEDQAQEAASELLRALSGDDERQDQWQPSTDAAMRRGSWDEAGASSADEYEDAEAGLEDDEFAAADYAVRGAYSVDHQSADL